MKDYFFIILILLSSCEEEITLNINQGSQTLVVEGAIEPGFPPYVILTKNQGYFDPVNMSTYENFFINSAEIKVWTNNLDGSSDTVHLSFISDSLPVFTDIAWNPYNYTFSQVGKTYFIEIKWDDKVITSHTIIPNPTPLDCLWVEESPTGLKDWECDIRALYSDPPGIQNNILIKSRRLEHYEKDSISGELDTIPDDKLLPSNLNR